MANGFPRAALSLLLAATVLSWDLSPPPTQHSHEGGNDRSHHHGCIDGADSRADDARLPHDVDDQDHSSSAVASSMTISGHPSHWHFEWLGLRLTRPDSGSPTNKDDNHGGNSKLLYVQAGRSSIPQVHSGGRLDGSPALLPPDAIAAGTLCACANVSGSSPRATPHPLCDRARHERSGVQLS